MTYNIKQCLDLVRHYNVLQNWTDEAIVDQLVKSILAGLFVYQVDSNAKLSAICFAKWHDSCCIHIIAIAGHSGSLKVFIDDLKQRYPSVKKITAERNNKPREYLVERL